MRRGAKPAKAKVEAKRPVARKSRKNEGSVRVRDLEKRLAEALDQQTATTEILKVISSSPTDIQPVFETIASNASRLCDGMWTVVVRYDGELIHLVADVNPRVDPAEHQRRFPAPASHHVLAARPILEGVTIHIADVALDPDVNQAAMAAFKIGAFLGVPMIRGDRALGSINISKEVSAPFTETQIALLRTFADQAVIAIENVRLFKELEARNSELTVERAEFAASVCDSGWRSS